MDASDFVKIVKDLVNSKGLDWTSFRERRIYDIGKRFTKGEIDADQAIVDIATELKVYNISRDEVKMLNDKLKK